MAIFARKSQICSINFEFDIYTNIYDYFTNTQNQFLTLSSKPIIRKSDLHKLFIINLDVYPNNIYQVLLIV